MRTETSTSLTQPSLAQRAAADRHRPGYHFVAPAGWLNDPNGLAQWNGTYHLFYQYNPDRPVHGQIAWGHASSPDLLHWTDHPVALWPDTPADADGCWSGVLVNDGGVPTIIYSGHRDGEGELPCLAVGDPTLTRWTKDPANPVIDSHPAGWDLAEFRDHCVWREDGRWRQLIGAAVADGSGVALLYESDDLRNWRFLGPLLRAADLGPDALWNGAGWECVDLLRGNGDQPDVLVFSAWEGGRTFYPVYVPGRYAGRQFTPTGPVQHLDHGLNYFYAPQSFVDEAGRRIMFGWVQEGRSDAAVAEAGWSGVMSLPRLVWLDEQHRLRQAPAPEVTRLRSELLDSGARTARVGEPIMLASQGSVQWDLELDARLADGAALEISLLATADGTEQTTLVVGRDGLRLDRSRSSRSEGVDTRELHAAVDLPDGVAQLRILLDHSVLEIFCNGVPLTARAYPTSAAATGVSVCATGGAVEITRLDCWAMASVWHGPREVRPA